MAAEESALQSQIESQIETSEEVVEEKKEEEDGSMNITTTKETKTEQVRVVEKRHIIVDMNGTSSKFITDSHENPFTADGELSKKAEYILRHSTISRSEIRISDPDLSKSSLDKTDAPTEQSPLVAEEAAQNARSPEEEKLKENGKVEQKALTPDTVQVEVATANASQPQPQQAEQVKLKEPKCKCCVIM